MDVINRIISDMVLAWQARLGARPQFLTSRSQVALGGFGSTADRLLGQCKATNTLKSYDNIIRYLKV